MLAPFAPTEEERIAAKMLGDQLYPSTTANDSHEESWQTMAWLQSNKKEFLQSPMGADIQVIVDSQPVESYDDPLNDLPEESNSEIIVERRPSELPVAPLPAAPPQIERLDDGTRPAGPEIRRPPERILPQNPSQNESTWMY